MIPSIIWTAAPDGAITYANEQWFRYCGLTAEQNARNWPELVLHPEDRQRCTEEWSRALKQGIEYEIEVRNRRHDGSYRWFVTRAIPFRDSAGRLLQWFGVTTDIDDRKRAEQTTRFLADVSKALAHLTDYHSTLQRIASLAVPFFADWCAVDMQEPDGSVRRLALTHTDPGKAKFAQELALRYPAQPLMPPLVMRVLQTGEPDWTAEISEKSLVKLAQDEEHLRLLKQLGLRSSLCVPLCSRSQTLGALTFVTAESGRVYDINDLRAAEELAHRATIAIENANLLAALKESDRRKDEFLAMLAHELRNPLAPIGNAVEILRTKETAAPGLRWANDIIARQLRQMTRLVDDLLDVSRITRGKIELRKERIELSAVVNSAVEASRPLIEKDRHELTILLPHEPIHLHADLTRLSQVISNLLNNAAKYTEPGGHIWLTAERQEGQVLIRVRDTGIGIQANMLPHIFEMFLQTDRSRERSQGGLGIGLSLVRRLVELHGGRVEAHSPGPGRGSEFIVHLPLSQNAGPKLNHVQDRPASHSSTRQDHRLKVLVVDDNTDSADSLAMLVEGLGSEVRTAYDGQEAVEVAAEFSPELVLLDLGLPKLNGYEAARAIRQQPGGDTILLVAVTGWGQEDDRRRSREAGFNHHLTKPVEFPTLQKLLAEASRVHSQAPG
jgi:PAS domain S-box-containing protein